MTTRKTLNGRASAGNLHVRARVGILCLAAFVLGALHAEDVYDVTTGFVTLLKSDTASPAKTSLSTAGNWSDGQPPHNDPPTNYYVAAGLSLRGPADNVMFPSPLFVAGDVQCGGASSKTATFTDLRILPGGSIRYDAIGKLAGRITFLSEDAENPSFIRYLRNDGYAVRLAAKILGSSSSQVKFNGTTRGKSWIPGETGADWSEFKGTLKFADGLGTRATNIGLVTPGTFAHGSNAVMIVNSGKHCSFGNLAFSGTSIVTNEAKVDVSGVLSTGPDMDWQSRNGYLRVSTVGTFLIGDRSSFAFHKASGVSHISTEVFHVTNRLAIGENVKMSFTLTAASGNTPAEYTVFKLSPEAVASGVPDFSSVSASMSAFAGARPEAFIAVKDDPDVEGGKIAYLTHKKIIAYIGPDQSSENMTKMDRDIDQTDVWSDGEFPQSGYDYFIGSNNSICFSPANSDHPNRVDTFPGDRLITTDLSVIYLYTSTTIPVLHAYGRTAIYPRVSTSLSGKLSLHRYSDSSRTDARMLGSIEFRLNSEIDGDGSLVAQSYYPFAGSGSTLYLGGMNTNWVGCLSTAWTKEKASNPDPSEAAHTRIAVGDGRNLGGALAAFRHDSLKLQNYAELRVTNTTTFAEATRGFLILTNGILNVDGGQTASLAAPITLQGTLLKTGGGMLSLGGPIRFGLNNDLEDATAPEAGYNVIDVRSGALKVTNAKALDGAALTFAADTSLHLDLRPAEAAMQSKGFLFSGGAAALSCTGRLPVVFEGGSLNDFNTGIDVPLCTVDASEAEAMSAKLQPFIDLGDRRCTGKMSASLNGDGTATIAVRFTAKGCRIIIR